MNSRTYKAKSNEVIESLAKMLVENGFRVFWHADEGFLVEKNGCTVSVNTNGDIYIHRSSATPIITNIHDPTSLDLLEKYFL